MKVKVCGMKLADNILAVDKLKPDYLGFIFYEGSPRYVGEEFSLQSAPEVSAKKVGVFVSASKEYVMKKAEDNGLDVVQLHGNEDSEYCSLMKKKFSGEVWKSISIESSADFDKVESYQGVVDKIIFDTKADSLGGSGRVFDWSLLKRLNTDVEFFVAGGLGPENCLDVVSTLSDVNAFVGCDFNSKLEEQPGVKSVERVKELMEVLNR